MTEEIINWLQIPATSIIARSMQGSIFELFILGTLLLMSAVSWGFILYKAFSLQSVIRSYRKFIEQTDLYDDLLDLQVRSSVSESTLPAQLFNEAYKEYEYSLKQAKLTVGPNYKKELLQRIERKIEKAIVNQNTELDWGLNMLATISGSAPFIGLLGTVIGIIDAFHSIGERGSSSIAVVAPGISSALMATALGLFTAIPALIAFNVFRDKNRIVSNDMHSFGLDLLNFFGRKTACYSRK
jgi:biopolymer transport protein TolQ